jgi:hypothetical protein
MNNVEYVLGQVKTDERLFGDGLIYSWQDFSSFRRAYEDDPWREDEAARLRMAFHLLRGSRSLESVIELVLQTENAAQGV